MRRQVPFEAHAEVARENRGSGEYAATYADRSERDYGRLEQAADEGRIAVERGV